MSTKNKYTSDFKKSIVNLYQSGKSYAQIHKEYGVSSSALSKTAETNCENLLAQNFNQTAPNMV